MAAASVGGTELAEGEFRATSSVEGSESAGEVWGIAASVEGSASMSRDSAEGKEGRASSSSESEISIL